MRPIEIMDLDDPRIAAYVDLRKARAASQRAESDETFVTEGRLLVDRVLESNYDVESILVSDGSHADLADQVDSSIPVYSLTRQMISQVVGFDFHRGVLACGKRREIPRADQWEFDTRNNLALAVLGIAEQENLGSILRTAAAFGIFRIYLGGETIDPLSRRVIRVSMGTALEHQFVRLENEIADLQRMRDAGIRIVASTLATGAEGIAAFRKDDRPMMLLIGNEAKGLDKTIQTLATDRMKIPMSAKVDSLNASVAAAILMYELTK